MSATPEQLAEWGALRMRADAATRAMQDATTALNSVIARFEQLLFDRHRNAVASVPIVGSARLVWDRGALAVTNSAGRVPLRATSRRQRLNAVQVFPALWEALDAH